MSPQKLSNFPNARSLRLVIDQFPERKDLSGYPIRIIGIYANIEILAARIFCLLLKVNPKVTNTIYDVIASERAKRDLMDKIGEMVLSDDPEMLALFKQTRARMSATREARNRLAHGVWAICDELPDAIILLDQDKLLEQSFQDEEYEQRLHEARSKGDPIPLRSYNSHRSDFRKAYVYRQGDFEREIRDAENTYDLVRLLYPCLAERYAASRNQCMRQLSDALKP